MFKNSKLASSVKIACALGSTVALLSSGNVFAQETANESEATVEKIAVTGSRIARPELSTPAPVVTIDAAEIQRFGAPDLGTLLAELPAIGAASTLIGNNNSNANAGISSPDLRALGATRTLTLVNGKRHVAGSPFSNAVDTGTIPTAMIDRIEVITGGASAIYGSDAVAGVINVILKDNYEGFEARYSHSSDLEDVGTQNTAFSILAGATSQDGRGNVTFFAEKSSITEVLTPSLQQAQNFGTVNNPENGGEDDGIADKFRVPNVGSEFINQFGVLNPFSGGPRITFTPDGTGIAQVERDLTNSFAFGSFDQAYDTVFFTEQYENYIPAQDTLTLASTFRYDITDNIRFYGDMKYVDKDIEQQFQPSFRFGNVSINATDNPFLDDGTRQQLFDAGQTGDVSMARFFDDIGNRSAANDRRLYRIVSGFKGYFTLSDTDFDYDAYYTYGETSNVRRTLNDLIPSNLNAALDAVIDPETGEAACRSQVPSAQGDDYEDPAEVNGGNCVPFNPFGFGNASAEAYDYISGDVTREDQLTQEMFGATVSFDTAEFFSLPGGAIGFALGFEHRKEDVRTTTDEFTKAGFYTGAATPDSFGGYDVEEFFVETRLPILSGVFLAEELSIDAAFRSADYSHAGNADAWQVGFLWTPIDQISLRGTVGEAVRAPNVDEAFSPQSPGFARVSDPCDADNIDEDADRRANCLALGIPEGFEANDNVSVNTLSGGNPDLTPEESESRTVGIVWQPTFAENLAITLDWYDIEITDAITSVSAQDIVDNCVDATGGPDTAFCSQVDRNENFDVDLVRSGFVNAAALQTSGLEMQIRYTTDLAQFDLPGELRFNVQGNYVDELEEFAFQERPDEINVEVGEVGDPELQFRTSVDYRLDNWKFNYTSRFIDRSALFDVSPDGGTEEDVDISYIGSIWTHDLAANYYMGENLEVYAGIRNIFNKVPPGYTFNPLYDLVGRRFNAGVIYRFE